MRFIFGSSHRIGAIPSKTLRYLPKNCVQKAQAAMRVCRGEAWGWNVTSMKHGNNAARWKTLFCRTEKSDANNTDRPSWSWMDMYSARRNVEGEKK